MMNSFYNYKEIDKKDIQDVYDVLVNAYKYDICKMYLSEGEGDHTDEINVILYLQENLTTCPVRIEINGYVYGYRDNKKVKYSLFAKSFEISHFNNESWNTSHKYFNEMIEKSFIEELSVSYAMELLYYLELLLDIKQIDEIDYIRRFGL